MTAPFDMGAFALAAANTIHAVSEAGARCLITEPWRVCRIIPGAEAMDVAALKVAVVDRARMCPPDDFNRSLALAQLARALHMPEFADAWNEERRAVKTEASADV